MKWDRVRKVVRCMFGHDIAYPNWALFTKQGSAVCEQHAYEFYKLVPTTHADDARMAQVGEDT